ncbi:MAG: hypothetical protein RI958_2078 [Actinomycetota bacterium]|jgi:hypothetical protein
MTERAGDQAATTDVSTNRSTPASGVGLLRADAIGTAVFVAALAVGLPLRDERSAQIVVGVVSMVLFVVGAVCCLWGYVNALERSRSDEIGVANLFLATGSAAPRPAKRLLIGLLVGQTVLALAGAIVGAVGLSGNEVNALAFGILVPMYGLGINALWIVRHGSFGPRVDRSVQPTNRKIG